MAGAIVVVVDFTFIIQGKLHLSIPWKNLYNEPTEVKIENLFVLAKPNNGNKLLMHFLKSCSLHFKLFKLDSRN